MIKRQKQLVNILNKANRVYYNDNNQIMTDFEYDKLYDELLDLEKQTGIILSNSPTQNVGYSVVSKLDKVQHSVSVLSLNKTKETDKLLEFLEDKSGILSFKMDGLTVVLNYKNGELYQAITRGNGHVGEDITHNAKFFSNIPLKINYKKDLILRGEALISYDEFEKINSQLEEKYKNPRNLCSGTVRQLNSNVLRDRKVEFLVFSIPTVEDYFKLKSEQLEFIKSLGFETVDYEIVDKNNIFKALKNFEQKIEKIQYLTDGLVLTYDDIKYSISLGSTSKFNRDSIAFKWRDTEEETILLNVEWNTSRTGLINPIAVFEPVELEGTTVKKASLHNLTIIENLKLGIGDKVKVYKANMIIPQISENLTKSDTLEIPKQCKECGAKTEIFNLKDGKFLKCTNDNCIAKKIEKIVHFVSRDAMNIEGFSKSTIKKFIEEGFIEEYVDIYLLEKYRDSIINLDNFGEKSYENLIEAINKSKNVNIENFIYALGIENVGLRNAKLLVKYYDYDFKKIKNSNLEDLLNIEGFGEIISENIYNYFSNKKNLEVINNILKHVKFKYMDNMYNKNLLNQNFVITGTLNHFKNRKELQDKIESMGGKVTSSVTKDSNYLINNDKLSTSTKNKKAIELGVNIISEEDFLKMLN